MPKSSLSPPGIGSILLRLRVLEKETDALRSSLFFVLFIEGAYPLKHPWVGLAPSEMLLVWDHWKFLRKVTRLFSFERDPLLLSKMTRLEQSWSMQPVLLVKVGKKYRTDHVRLERRLRKL